MVQGQARYQPDTQVSICPGDKNSHFLSISNLAKISPASFIWWYEIKLPIIMDEFQCPAVATIYNLIMTLFMTLL
jgi:hypothetical protein